MTDIVLPTDQTEGTSNVVGKWFKAVGDPVSRNEPLLEITTDKVTVEIAAPVSGVLAEILKPEGEAVEPGQGLVACAPRVPVAPLWSARVSAACRTDGSRRTAIGGQRSEVRSQRSEVRGG